MKAESSQRQSGFTLIEIVVALLLFSLLMGCLWEFYGNTYITYTKFDNKTTLNDEAKRVNSFIREEIRLADQVTIKVTDSTLSIIHPPQTPKTSESSMQIKDKQLYAIELRTSGAGIRKSDRSVKLIRNMSIGRNQGKYSLIYTANHTDSTIADKIENIKVTREEDSSIVEFECTLNKDGELQNSQKVKNIFSESLQYKEKYIP